jgi:hypothetical protein
MNHPLPKTSVDAATEYAFEQDAPMEPEMVTMSAGQDDPYEEYRRRMMQSKTLDMEARGLPAAPRMDYGGSVSRYERARPVFYDPPPTAMPDFEDMASIDLHERPSFSRNVVLAGLAAIVAGAGLGYALANMDTMRASTGQALAFMGSVLPANNAEAQSAPTPVAAQPVTTTIISKKPIATATLDVGDVQGTANTVIPLSLRAEAGSNPQDLGIRITGLPQSAFLSAGQRLSDNSWLLKPGEERGVGIIVPTADVPRLDLSVAAVELKTGELAAPIREMTVALQAAAPAPGAKAETPPANQLTAQMTAQTAAAGEIKITPAGAPPENASAKPIPQPVAATPVAPPVSAEAAGLLQKGDTLFKSGDLVMAREFYERAFEMGAGAGAYGVARTYDPAVFLEMNVKGLDPDPAQALAWYEKAKTAGIAEASAAMEPLRTAAIQ